LENREKKEERKYQVNSYTKGRKYGKVEEEEEDWRSWC